MWDYNGIIFFRDILRGSFVGCIIVFIFVIFMDVLFF